MNRIYENKYGRVEIQVVGPYQNVNTIVSRDIESDLFLSIEDAEKIALITGNRDIQLCLGIERFFMVHHQSTHVAAVCRVVSLEFMDVANATAILSRNPAYDDPWECSQIWRNDMSRRIAYEKDGRFAADAYTVRGWRGIAFHVLGWELRDDEDTVWDGIQKRTGHLVMVMVGDDRYHSIDPDDITAITSEEYCGDCGQVGCGC